MSIIRYRKLQTSPYKPSTNQVERLHRTINTILGKTVADHQRDWDTRFPYAMAAYRASRHETTGYSANFLTMGRETRGPVDVVFGTAESESSTETYDDFVEAIRSRMTTAYSEVRMSLRRSAERNSATTIAKFGLKSTALDNGFITSTRGSSKANSRNGCASTVGRTW